MFPVSVVPPTDGPCRGDQRSIAADLHLFCERPEVGVFGFFQFVQLHARIDRIQLQVEGCGLNSLLFLTGQLGKTIGKCIGDSELHQVNCHLVVFLIPGNERS